jgi:two-component system, OmpR family, alkaline phosphatase synthesis response regulator PhoP
MKGKVKILIVEDEIIISELLQEVFSNIGDYEVYSAMDGEEALYMARENDPDVILLDIQLPKVNGHDVCRLVKADSSLSHARVLMISGGDQNSDRQKALDAGADDYMVKPFKPSVLLGKVEAILNNTRNG